MAELLVVLTRITLADSLSVVPMCIVPLAILLAGRRPLFGSAMFLSGVVIPYYSLGVVVSPGLDQVFDRLPEWLKEDPDTLDLFLQLIIGSAPNLLWLEAGGEKRSGRTQGDRESLGSDDTMARFCFRGGLHDRGRVGRFSVLRGR